jgi:hypothetical protein
MTEVLFCGEAAQKLPMILLKISTRRVWMFKKIGVLCLLGMMVLLAACSSPLATQATNQPENTTGTVMVEGTPQPGQVPTEMKLLLGTFSLEGSDQAVSAEQAAQLLPLWKAMKSLSSSDTTSQDEINALINQIEESMTEEQMTAIDAMNLDNQSMMDIMQDLGISMGPSNLNGTPASAEQEATRQAFRESGGVGGFVPGDGPGGGGGGGFNPGGGPGGGEMPAGGGGFPGGVPPDAAAGQNGELRSTSTVGRRGGMSMLNPMLVEELIKLLQERAV